MRKSLVLTAIAVMSIAAPEAAKAALTIDIDESGSAVVANVSGTLSLSGLIFLASTSGSPAIRPEDGFLSTGSGGTGFAFDGFSGPSTWGPGGQVFATTGSGDRFAMLGEFGFVTVNENFVSGSSIVSSATFNNATLASLGLTIGQYVYTSSGDSITVNIGRNSAVVPEPATWAMMLMGFGAVGFAMRRRKQTELTFRRAT